MLKQEAVYEANAEKLITALASELKKEKEFEIPSWAVYVKTGTAKERPPENYEWWFIRAASILRQLYIHKTVGVNRLRTKYGSKKDRGMKPKHFRKGAGKNIRMILQQAEKAGLVEKAKAGKRAGRKLTEKGIELLKKIATSVK